ncbi:hypothetical protein ACFVYT_40015 [Streptomyces sp. NPDC058290]|uniref:hypothetical protein n=1 Tax=Streptomyces sp. NPDC058290 TaxID=3346426 RepID=UPI0036EE4CA0
MWTDDYAAQCGFAANAPVEVLLALYRRPQPVVGRALFTGSATPHGVEGLTFDQVLAVLDRLLAHASPSDLNRQVLAASSWHLSCPPCRVRRRAAPGHAPGA